MYACMYIRMHICIYVLLIIRRRDSFLLSCPELGRLEKIRIRHDNSGFGASWFLEEVEVAVGGERSETEGREAEMVRFPCGKWLEMCEGCGGQLEVDLFPVGVARSLSTQDVGMLIMQFLTCRPENSSVGHATQPECWLCLKIGLACLLNAQVSLVSS